MKLTFCAVVVFLAPSRRRVNARAGRRARPDFSSPRGVSAVVEEPFENLFGKIVA
jgi:hypothetical protein